MIAFLDGQVVEKGADRVLLSVAGVGYEVLTPAHTSAGLPAPGRRAQLFTRLQVRDESMVLYGFSSSDERTLFDQLVTVSGVGPKAALAVLSVLKPDALRRAVVTGDVASLTLVPGIGKKVAGRLIVDLKDKLGVDGTGDGAATGVVSEVREALLALGLSPQEARDALSGLSVDGDGSVEDLLRQALRTVGR